jgi:PiT family inorganic phosphate transporter
LAYRITRKTPSAQSNSGFKYGQAFTASMVALAHGTSDGQKTMGVITLVLIAANLQASGTRPQLWVIITAGIAIGLGTYSGGWRIMRTMGKGIVEIETPQGAASGASTSATILASAHLGFGLSTTHVSTGSILGSGVGREGAEVRWSVARRMVFAWLLTLPGAALVGGLAALLSDEGVAGVVALMILLAGACLVIYVFSRRNKITHANVIDSHEVLVLAAATPSTYADDPRLEAPPKPKKIKRPKARSAA